MKIGLVSPYDFASPGGVTDHVIYLAGELRNKGQEVRIFAPSSRADIDFDTREFYRIGSPIPVPVNDSVARITLSFHLANRVAAIIEQEAFDVLHFHEPLMPALPSRCWVYRPPRTSAPFTLSHTPTSGTTTDGAFC